MPEWIAALLGVFIGFFLSEGTAILKEKARAKKYRTALFDELETILYQISQKEDIAIKMLEAMKENKFLPGLSTSFASTMYIHYFPSIIHTFSPIERDNIRHIYSTTNTLDTVMSNIETEYKQDINGTGMANVNAAYSGKIKDVIATYSVLKELINSLVNMMPKDIYYRHEQKT